MTKDIRTIFSNNLKRYMQINGENLTKLSDDIGVAYSTVSDWLHGKKMPRSGSLDLLAEHYNINISDLTSAKDIDSPKGTTFYNYFDAGISAGTLQTVDPFTSNEVETIDLPDVIMGRYANDPSIFITRINGESMNRVLPNGSLIAVKKFKTLLDLKDGDIVIFQDGGDLSVKRFYNDTKGQILTFMPDSTESDFVPINYRYESADKVNIIGKVVIYTVEL